MVDEIIKTAVAKAMEDDDVCDVLNETIWNEVGAHITATTLERVRINLGLSPHPTSDE